MSDKTNATTPERAVELFTELMGEGDLDSVMELYAPGAAFKPSGRAPITGAAAIRNALTGLAGLKPKFISSIKGVVSGEDTALVVLDWSMTGRPPLTGKPRARAASALTSYSASQTANGASS